MTRLMNTIAALAAAATLYSAPAMADISLGPRGTAIRAEDIPAACEQAGYKNKKQCDAAGTAARAASSAAPAAAAPAARDYDPDLRRLQRRARAAQKRLSALEQWFGGDDQSSSYDTVQGVRNRVQDNEGDISSLQRAVSTAVDIMAKIGDGEVGDGRIGYWNRFGLEQTKGLIAQGERVAQECAEVPGMNRRSAQARVNYNTAEQRVKTQQAALDVQLAEDITPSDRTDLNNQRDDLTAVLTRYEERVQEAENQETQARWECINASGMLESLTRETYARWDRNLNRTDAPDESRYDLNFRIGAGISAATDDSGVAIPIHIGVSDPTRSGWTPYAAASAYLPVGDGTTSHEAVSDDSRVVFDDVSVTRQRRTFAALTAGVETPTAWDVLGLDLHARGKFGEQRDSIQSDEDGGAVIGGGTPVPISQHDSRFYGSGCVGGGPVLHVGNHVNLKGDLNYCHGTGGSTGDFGYMLEFDF